MTELGNTKTTYHVVCNNATIGPSGVRALPLAAGINEGGHYFHYIFAGI